MFERGTLLTPAHLGVLASLDVHEVSCHPRPRVGVISTGDELVERGALAPGPHPRLEPADAARVDRRARVRRGRRRHRRRRRSARSPTAIEHAADSCDALLTSGAVSVGDYDFVKLVLERVAEAARRLVAVGAGRDQTGQAARVRDARSGPGVRAARQSGVVPRELRAVRPARAAQARGPRRRRGRAGRRRPRRPPMRRRPDGKLHLDRVRVWVDDGRYVCERAGAQASNVLSGMASANGLALLPRRRRRRGRRRGPAPPAVALGVTLVTPGVTSRVQDPLVGLPLLAWYNVHVTGSPGGRNAMPGGGNRVASATTRMGWRDAAPRGSEDPSAEVGRCAERGARANPPPGRHAGPGTTEPTPNLKLVTTPRRSGPADRSVRAARQGSAGLDHRSLQLPLRLLHARRGDAVAAPRGAAHLRGDRPDRPGLRRALRLRGDPGHRRRAARAGARDPARAAARAARRRHRDDDERRAAARSSRTISPRPGCAGSTSRSTRCSASASSR